MKSRFVIVLYTIVALFIFLNKASDWENKLFRHDSFNYHLYLPAVFIYNDVQTLSFYPELRKKYIPNSQEKWQNVSILNNGNRVNKYTVGVAVHELPFFLIAHFICKHFTQHPADGYSLPYEWGGIISNIFWVLLGLLVLRKFLKKHFDDNVVAITLLAISFGTNIYHYTVFDVGMSHPYSFFHFAWVLLLTLKFHETQKNKHLYLLAFSLGCIALLRPSNLLVGIIPLLWRVDSFDSLKQQLQFWIRKYKTVMIAAIIFLIAISPQLLYWKYTAGTWLFDSYEKEGFLWLEPKLIEGLFGFRKGWFVYTPIAFIAIVGFFFLNDKLKTHCIILPLFLLINVYIIFSWWNWWYGGGFSCRPLVESLPILSVGLASVIYYLQKRSNAIKYISSVVLVLLVSLNMVQSYQTSKGIIHWDRMTRKAYFDVFLKTTPKLEYQDNLLDEGVYFDELSYRYNNASK